jgi:hypothetical protein
MDTQSIVAHNINEQMQRNQHGGCAMMAMGRSLLKLERRAWIITVWVDGVG